MNAPDLNASLQQFAVSLRLHFRNKMALIYSYLFPAIFLIAFWVLYRYERVPLARHMGELLTVSVLGGACFGLPTTMVSERERGVWRRYRLTPLPTRSLVASTVGARYITLLTAGLLQLALAMSIGMPLPQHPLDLWLAFTCVTFAFVGLGLVIAMLADNVPAVQALGQCIFLPMLIIGGVAVPLSSLPAWAQHVSAFFPGRYAVETLQACVTGTGLGGVRFSLLALLLIGAAGCLAGAKMFRWDAQQRFATREGKAWLALALAAWAVVGLSAEWRGRGRVATSDAQNQTAASTTTPMAATPTALPQPGAPALPIATLTEAEKAAARTPPSSTSTPKTLNPSVASPVKPTAAPAAEPAAPAGPRAKSWQDVTLQDTEEWAFNRLPPDAGVVTPIAPSSEEPDADISEQLEVIRTKLVDWKPGKVDDPVQRVRNYLFVAAVPDVFQMPTERYVPLLVFDQIQHDVPKDQLIKILYWIAWHPDEGDDKAVDQLQGFGLGNGPSDISEVRNRSGIYALKLLGRLLGKITVK